MTRKLHRRAVACAGALLVATACSAGSVLTDRSGGSAGQASLPLSPATVDPNRGANGASSGNVVVTSPPSTPGNANLPTSPVGTQTPLQPNDFFAGIHINWDAETGGVGGFVGRVGFVPSLCAGYVTATSGGGFESDKAHTYADDVAKNGGTAISYAITAQITSLNQTQLTGLADAVTYARGKGLVAWVRYGYEMNGNWSPAYHGGDPGPFLSQWAQAENVVHAAGGKMIWAPNLSGSGDYNRWLPDPDTIDQIGLDAYHQTGDITAGEVDGFIGSIYPLVQRLQKPFVLTETAVVVVGDNTYRVDAAEVAQKKVWLNQLVDPSLRQKYPLYRGFVWFDYQKTESASGVSSNDVQWRNFSISVDSLAAAMVKAWYPTVFGASSTGSAGVQAK